MRISFLATCCLLLTIGLCLTACDTGQKIQTVNIPVAVKAIPPKALTAPIADPLPTFIAPTDPHASSALTAEGEKQLKILIHDLNAKVNAWTTWASSTK